MDREELAIEVRMLRKARGLTQPQLAALPGAPSERTIRTIESGKKDVDAKSVADLYRAMGFPQVPTTFPEDVRNFLEMVGFRLARLAPAARHDLMQKVHLMVVEYRASA